MARETFSWRNGMHPFQQRVIDEKAELDERLEKLRAFILTETFETLSAAEQARMAKQKYAMESYRQVLSERIEAFDTKPEKEPRLGYATTRQLLAELTARFEVHADGGLDYRTVGGEEIAKAGEV